MDSLFSSKLARHEEAEVMSLSGELDLMTAPSLQDAMQRAPVVPGGRFVVDLSALTFIDSTGLRLLTQCKREMAERGVRMSVVAPTCGIARKVLEITRLVELLGVTESLEAALSNVGRENVGAARMR